MTGPATTAQCGTTPVNAATPSTYAPHGPANDRARSTPNKTQTTSKSPDIQPLISEGCPLFSLVAEDGVGHHHRVHVGSHLDDDVSVKAAHSAIVISEVCSLLGR